MRRAAALLTASLCLPGAALAQGSLQILRSNDPILGLGSFAFEGGKTLELSVGIGSGAFRSPRDPANAAWFVSDRGPNIACSDVEAVTGVKRDVLCAAARGGRVYPVPSYAPSIYYALLDRAAGTFRVVDQISLKTASGVPLSGLLNTLTVASTEIPLDGKGRVLAQSADAIDAEGLVRLSDGTFWIGEENGPSIAHVAADGRVLLRIVPDGTAKDFAAAGYPVAEGLPAVLTKRQLNRGIESMAISPDERFLYFILQNPLANPDAAAFRDARNARLFKMDRATQRLVGEWIYQLDDPRSFRLDPSNNQSAPRISELMALGTDRLLVLERTEGTTKLHEVDLRQGATNILGSSWDDAATRPSLEQSNDLAAIRIVPLAKTLRFDTADHREVPVKVEGLAILGDGSLLLVNDDDFGITGERTRIVVWTGHGLRFGD